MIVVDDFINAYFSIYFFTHNTANLFLLNFFVTKNLNKLKTFFKNLIDGDDSKNKLIRHSGY